MKCVWQLKNTMFITRKVQVETATGSESALVVTRQITADGFIYFDKQHWITLVKPQYVWDMYGVELACPDRNAPVYLSLSLYDRNSFGVIHWLPGFCCKVPPPRWYWQELFQKIVFSIFLSFRCRNIASTTTRSPSEIKRLGYTSWRTQKPLFLWTMAAESADLSMAPGLAATTHLEELSKPGSTSRDNKDFDSAEVQVSPDVADGEMICTSGKLV